MLKSSLCDYSDAQIPFTERIIINGAGDDAAHPDKQMKEIKV